MKLKRFRAILIARNREFLRDRSALAWNFLFPVLIVIGFAFAFSDKTINIYKVGIIGDPNSALIKEHSFFKTKHITFVPLDDLKNAIVKIEKHQLDMLFDLNTRHYWVNNESPGGYILERVLLSSKQQTSPHETTLATPFIKQKVTGRAIRYIDWLVPGILAMNIMFSALFGVGYVMVRYRKNGVLKRLKATPLSAFEFLSAQIASRLWLVMLITVAVYIGADLFLNLPMYGSYFNLFLVFVLGSISMISVGLLVAARTTSEEFAGGILNLISWPMMFLSGVWFSLEGIHPALQKLALLFPLTHLISAARAIMLDGASLMDITPQLLTLSLISIALLIIGAMTFRWN
ncbi:MAG: ABC transporter permease [Gammaproteobacteria bacterium]|nr:ABC transporter permease [Gammaproteobacteria bacterium]